ncbi:MAG: hypothetical protein EAZ07_00515 [Cytophagales bacterium]|nr:MAG: hypothetical protein EAZ07_00515 [Cytophagales bacterium]
MKIKKIIIVQTYLMFLSIVSYAQNPIKYTIAKWLDNKKAAVSITFDDAINGQFTEGLSILDANNIKGTFFITSQNVTSQLGSWSLVLKAYRNKHEIANHTITHASLANLSEVDINKEITSCNDAIYNNIKSNSQTFAYPNGSGGGDSEADIKVRKILKKYFIGARAVGGDFNSYDFFDNEENYFKVRSPMISNGDNSSSIANKLSGAINAGGWFCPTYHGIENGWIIVPKVLFDQHIKEILKRKDDIWVSTFENVIKYHRERKSANLVITPNIDNWTLLLNDTLKNDLIWNHPLTIIVDKPNWIIHKIVQNNKELSFTDIGNQVMFNAIPDGGTITFQKFDIASLINDVSSDKSAWLIAPNPANEVMEILNLENEKNYQIKIYSDNSTIVSNLDLIAKNNKIDIPIKDYKKGIYYVSISGIVKKVIIQ